MPTTLHNGIVLPAPWPPRLASPDLHPMRPPYLDAPPPVIQIDIGRQLFVDDFLIASTTLSRALHRPEYHPSCPVLRAEHSWEVGARGPMAMPFSGGVWWDTADKIFKMWYRAGHGGCMALAVSGDGVRWERPPRDVVAGTAVVAEGRHDTDTVWIDPNDPDPARRYKMFRTMLPGGARSPFAINFSADGVHWGDPVLSTGEYEDGGIGDRSTVFWNPFRKVWVFSLKHGWEGARARRYWETPSVVPGPGWDPPRRLPPFWVGADPRDPECPEFAIRPELYNLDAAAYESVIIGLFAVWRGDYRFDSKSPEALRLQAAGRPKSNEVFAGFSRDGWHWDRPDRQPFCPRSDTPGDWNWGNVQSAAPCCLIAGDKLHFYLSGRAGKSYRGPPPCNDHDSGGSTGLAILRRDGFASMDAGDAGGVLVTRPVLFTGKRLFVNIDAPRGELRAEALDESGRPIAPFTAAQCSPVSTDKTIQAVTFKGATDLSAVAGRKVKFRFHLRSGRLYSFWVSPDSSGASRGHLAGGGPGYKSYVDEAGV
jgi:hypothetical protein